MPTVRIPAFNIRDWDSFHDVLAEALGFPRTYGRTVSALIDSLTYREAPGDSMASVNVPPGDVLALQIDGVAGFRLRCPDQYDAIIDATAVVNLRRIAVGEKPLLVLAFAA
jgi:hypothetical protein